MAYDSSKTQHWDNIYTRLSKDRKIDKDENFVIEGKVFASSAGEACEEKLRFQFLGTKKKFKDIWHGKEAKIGDVIHDEIQKDLKKKFGDRIEIEGVYPLEVEGVTINCRIDAIMNKELVMEFKTCKDSEGMKPKKEHILQANFYMGVTGIKKAVISYFKRSNGLHIGSFHIDYDAKMYKDVVGKFKRVINGKFLKHSNKFCKFCPYSYKCKFAR